MGAGIGSSPVSWRLLCCGLKERFDCTVRAGERGGREEWKEFCGNVRSMSVSPQTYFTCKFVFLFFIFTFCTQQPWYTEHNDLNKFLSYFWKFHTFKSESDEKFHYIFCSICVQVFLGICVRWTLMSAPALPARMELNVQMVPTSTPVNVPKVN